MFKKILCSVDFSEVSNLALIAVLPIADRCGAEIHIAHVLTHRVHKQDSAVDGTGIEYHRRMYRAKLESLVSNTVPDASHEVLVGESVSEEILKCARALGCDLILIGSHGRTAMGEIAIGSTTEKLLHVSELPVMIIRSPIYRSAPQVEFRRILAAVDFSDTSLNALVLAMKFSSFLGAELNVVHVVDPLILRDLQTTHPDLRFVTPSHNEMRNSINILLAQILEAHRCTAPVKVTALFGNPAYEIAEYATHENCDFLFMGTRGRRPAERLFLGSNSRGVLDRVHIPLVMVSDLFRLSPDEKPVATTDLGEPQLV